MSENPFFPPLWAGVRQSAPTIEAAGSGMAEAEMTRLRHREAELEAEVARLRAAEGAAGKARYRTIFDSAIDFAIIATDREGRITDWNTGAEHIFGWSAEEMRGEPATRIFTPEDRAQDRIGTEMRGALQTGRASDERWHLRKDGARFWANGEMMPLRDEDGTHLGFIKILHDHTKQRLAAEQQRADTEFLRSILASSDDCIEVLDLDGKLIFMSEGGRRVMGITDFDAIVGRHWRDVWQEDGSGKPLAAVAAAKAGGIGHFQGLAATSTGTFRWWDVQVTPIRGADGRPATLLSIARDITTTRQAKEALREAKGLTTLILNSSRDCIVVLDLDGHNLFVSPGGIKAMEIADVTAILGLSWLRVWRGTDLEAARAAVAEARAGGIGRFQGFCPTHKGTPKWWDVVISPLPGPDGRPERLVSVGRDITEAVHAQQRLSFSEESLRLATEAAEVGTWDLDLKADVLTWSDRTKAMFGISPQVSCSMRDFYSGLHPEDRDATSAAFAAALDPERRITYDVEYRTVGREDGIIRWVAAKGRGLFEDGRCARAIGTAIDVTARKLAETRQAFLLGLSDRLRGLSDPRAIMATTVEALGLHLGVSRVGYGQVQSDDMTIVLETNYVDGVAPLTGAFELATFGAGNVARQRHGMTVVFEDVTADPALDPAVWTAIETRALVSVPLVRDGRFIASLYVNHRDPRAWPHDDITLIRDVAERTWDAVERARAEAALREANAMLEQRVAAALAEREKIEEALRQSQKMEAVGQLTGGLAHDFNNLLAGISGSLELMQTRLGQGRLGDLERYITAAQTAARRAASLTHRLLAFSRRQTLDPKPTNINRLVKDMEDLIRRTVGPAVELDVLGAAALWTTLVDPNQLENALLNLCINARDAMPDGGRLTIEMANRRFDETAAHARELAPGQYLSLSVTDTGSGMSPEVMARAFDPFFTTKPIGQGTGLGLSMIYGFARQSGGQVSIDSQLGRGTTMCLTLPRYHGQEDAADAKAPRAEAPRAEAGETVMVVDDEPGLRMLVTDVLEELGYTAIEAADGAAGLKLLQSDARIDLLITDVGLPGGMNGRQLADAGRVVRPQLKVLFITGYAETAVIGHGRLDPGMQVLTKPFAMEALASRIKDLIAAIGAADGPQRDPAGLQAQDALT